MDEIEPLDQEAESSLRRLMDDFDLEVILESAARECIRRTGEPWQLEGHIRYWKRAAFLLRSLREFLRWT